MTCTFRSLIRGLTTTFVLSAAGAQLAAAGPLTALETVELALNRGGPADLSSQNLDGLGVKAVFEALGPGRSGEGIAELNRIDFGRLTAVSTGNLAAFRPDVDRRRAGTDVVPVPEPASLLLLTTGLGALAYVRRRTKPL